MFSQDVLQAGNQTLFGTKTFLIYLGKVRKFGDIGFALSVLSEHFYQWVAYDATLPLIRVKIEFS